MLRVLPGLQEWAFRAEEAEEVDQELYFEPEGEDGY